MFCLRCLDFCSFFFRGCHFGGPRRGSLLVPPAAAAAPVLREQPRSFLSRVVRVSGSRDPCRSHSIYAQTSRVAPRLFPFFAFFRLSLSLSLSCTPKQHQHDGCCTCSCSSCSPLPSPCLVSTPVDTTDPGQTESGSAPMGSSWHCAALHCINPTKPTTGAGRTTLTVIARV